MNASVQTKETPTALSNLLKAKGQRPSGRVQAPVATVVENAHTEVPVTPELNPEVVDNTPEPVTPVIQDPEPNDGRGDYRESYINLKAHHDKSIYEERQKVKQLEAQVSQLSVKKVELPKTKEEIETFKNGNKDAYDIIRSVVLEEISNDGTLNDIHNRIAEVNKATAKLEEKEALKKLLEEHPDALEIRESPKFATWFNEQPDDIKRILINSNDVKAVSKQLTLYKIETGIPTAKDKKKLEQQKREENSVEVRTRGQTEINPAKKIWTGTEINAISGNYKMWLKHREEIDAARRENRVDMSK